MSFVRPIMTMNKTAKAPPAVLSIMAEFGKCQQVTIYQRRRKQILRENKLSPDVKPFIPLREIWPSAPLFTRFETEEQRLLKLDGEREYKELLLTQRITEDDMPSKEQLEVDIHPYYRGKNVDGRYENWLDQVIYDGSLPRIVRRANQFRGFKQLDDPAFNPNSWFDWKDYYESAAGKAAIEPYLAYIEATKKKEAIPEDERDNVLFAQRSLEEYWRIKERRWEITRKIDAENEPRNGMQHDQEHSSHSGCKIKTTQKSDGPTSAAAQDGHGFLSRLPVTPWSPYALPEAPEPKTQRRDPRNDPEFAIMRFGTSTEGATECSAQSSSRLDVSPWSPYAP